MWHLFVTLVWESAKKWGRVPAEQEAFGKLDAGEKHITLKYINSKSILLAICEEYYVYLLLATEYIEC